MKCAGYSMEIGDLISITIHAKYKRRVFFRTNCTQNDLSTSDEMFETQARRTESFLE